MQAGRVLPQARWTNPRRMPALARNPARITEAAKHGQPASAGGAANPRDKGDRRERGSRLRESELQLPIGTSGRRGSLLRHPAVCGMPRAHGVAVLCAATTDHWRIQHSLRFYTAFLYLIPSCCLEISQP
jgi:hypothetical protein